MKVLIGTFINEANANIPHLSNIKDFEVLYGEDLINKMEVREVFEGNGIEIIPAIYASAGAAGVIERNTFDFILKEFENAAKKHLNEIDGIYLMLHGASEVEGLGSGDHAILWALRKIVGPYVPIAVACDPHGNLCKEYTDRINIIRSYRQSPHTDASETRFIVSRMLVDLMKNRQNIYSCYRKLPLILGGEQSVSTDEPVASINKYMDEMEKDPRVRSASWHVGYIRHDTDVAGCGVVVVPQNTEDQQYCEKKVDELAEYVWNKRHEFHYTGLTAEPEDALKMVLESEQDWVSLTDSGDNTTSGASGWNTYVLRQVLAVKDLKKKVLFATINHPASYEQLKDLEEGTVTHISLGQDHDELSKAVELDVCVKSKGDIVRSISLSNPDNVAVFGNFVLVNVVGTPIDIMVANSRQAMREEVQYRYAGIDHTKYNIIIIKVGYNYPMFTNNNRFWVMSLTDGPTIQNTKKLPFKRIMRPMFPIDEI